MAFRHLHNVRGFFSDYYLGSVLGRTGRRGRLSDRAADLAYARFRRTHERADGRAPDPPACRERLIRPFLRDVLGLHLGAGEDRVHPVLESAAAEAEGARPLLVAYCGGWDEDLDAGIGAARPRQQVEVALARGGLRHGILVTGQRLWLVRAPGDGPRNACLAADLEGLAENDDPESFAALLLLLSARSFLPAADGKIPIDEIERESRAHAEKVSEDLKGAVFTAAESLVDGLLRDAVARGAVADAAALSDQELRQYRDAALTAIYRILFILYAEERDPRLDEHRLYRDTYSMQGLVEQLLHDPARAWPENRSTLWPRLRALFRIYDEGLPAITPWHNIPPRGGDFFDPTTPHGRVLDDARLPDRSVAQLVRELATTPPRAGVGRERVSFRELDIESLGAVYEGLLEFEPRVARETTLHLRVHGRTYVLPPGEVVRLCTSKNLTVRGDLALVADTEAEMLHPDSAVGGEEESEDHDSEGDEDADDELDEDEEEDVETVGRGATAALTRRVERGTFHFVPGPARKGSGSFYTPLALVQDVVRHALRPLLTGRPAVDIERLRVLDPACGSAHFLVEAMRFLGQALHRAYVAEHGKHGPPHFRSTTGLGWDDACEVADAEARAANSEARAWCKRRIAERCLFGVDMNPTAVALARVALWIESLAGDRPLTYFEHHVRPGNSLLGTWLTRLDDPPLPDMGGTGAPLMRELFVDPVRRVVQEAARLRALIDRADPEALRREGVEPESTAEQDFKESQRRRAEAALAAARLLFDLRSAALFVPAIWSEWAHLTSFAMDGDRLDTYARGRPWWEDFAVVRMRERFFHWELEFPEVFFDPDRQGFDAVLGNPPWDKVLPARHEFYARHDVLIRAYKGNDLEARIRELHAAHAGLAAEFAAYRERTTRIARYLRRGADFPHSEARTQAAHEDVSKYFLDRAARLAGPDGAVGMVVPSVVYNGDGCVGLRRFLLDEAAIERFYGFENRESIFPIHSSYKFVSLVFRRGVAADGFDAAFMRHDLAELEDPDRKPWIVRVTREEIRRLSPETLAFLEYRSPRDQGIARRMAEGKPRLGGDDPGSWGAVFFTDFSHAVIYNATRDQDLWTNPTTGRLWAPADVLGTEPLRVDETIERMRARGFWPVYEGKNTDLLLVGVRPIRCWLSLEQAATKYGKALPTSLRAVVYRQTASNTNERTWLGVALPAASAATNTLTGVTFSHVDAEAACTVMASLAFDFALRLRVSSHVSLTNLRPMPVPSAPGEAWERRKRCNRDLGNLSTEPSGYPAPPGKGWPPAGTECCVVAE